MIKQGLILMKACAMTDHLVSSNDPSRTKRVDAVILVRRRRHRITQEKVRLAEETYLPDQTISLVATG